MERNEDSLIRRVIEAAWTEQPTLMKMLSVVAVTLVILAYGADAIRNMGAHNILVALLLGGGIVLVIAQFIAGRGRTGSGNVPTWLKALRFTVALALGTASIVTALLLNEAYSADEEAKPVTRLLARLKPSKAPCEPTEGVQVIDAKSFSDLEQFQRSDVVNECNQLKKLDALRLSESIDLPSPLEVWASYVEVPADKTITLRDKNLIIHTVEIRGGGSIVGWPENEPKPATKEAGKDGLKGTDSANLTLDIHGKGSGTWTVDLRGQQGGAGARGTTGATGREGKRGRKASTGAFDCRRGGGDGERGGKGFKGGRGGNGGPGGDGGTLTFKKNPETLHHVYWSNIRFEDKVAAGGKRGAGGAGGAGGPGGKGGSGKGHCGGGRSGPRGEQGDPGDPGTEGANGKPPKRDPAPQDVPAQQAHTVCISPEAGAAYILERCETSRRQATG